MQQFAPLPERKAMQQQFRCRLFLALLACAFAVAAMQRSGEAQLASRDRKPLYRTTSRADMPLLPRAIQLSSRSCSRLLTVLRFWRAILSSFF